MTEPAHFLARTDDLRTRPVALRRLCVVPMLGLLAAAALLLTPALASADSSSSLTVVGTSDVSDSGLIPNLIQPEFEKAYPKYTFKYIGTATGTAITDAESGSVGASALIVHAASLENQFVGSGYSYEQYGRAIFTNDFVLAGPKSDPAGVAANGATNIAEAFADIATAAVNGGKTPKVTFVSRGGTPGTTVEEHKIWALVGHMTSPPAGLLLCAVNSTNGGGETPIAAGNGVTASGQPCPNSGALPAAGALPSWYVATGLTQGPNVVAANACNGYPSGANTCYVLTDRGTFDYLASGTDPAGTIPNLTIATHGPQSASAPGGADALINYFHAYIINPGKAGETVNLPAAQAFLNFLTSPAVQAQLKQYLPTGDPGGPPFVADAAPTITSSGIPSVYHAGKNVTVTGTVTNAEPGYPVLAGKTVTVDEIVAGVPVPVASGTTSATGSYSIAFAPASTGSYEVATPQIAQIENSTLTPPFGDLLSPGAAAPVAVTVHGTISNLHVKSEGGKARVVGSVAPGAGHVKGTVEVLARRGSKGAFKKLATDRLSPGDAHFAIVVPLKAHRWQIKVKFQDPTQVVGTTSHKVKVTVAAKPPSSLTVRSAKVKTGGALTIAGSVRRKAPAGGPKVELLALNTTAGTPARFKVIAKAKLGAGEAKFTLHAKLKPGNRWILQLEYILKGQAPSFSKLRSTDVK